MWGDELKIRQILINILGNAAKFTTGGDITLDVIARADDRRATTRSSSSCGTPASA